MSISQSVAEPRHSDGLERNVATRSFVCKQPSDVGHKSSQAAGYGARKIVPLAATMRSGSTLLKALLAQAPDVTHLPEFDFQKLGNRQDPLARILSGHERTIVVLKRPAWYHESRSYPSLPDLANTKVILLVRDVYETVESLRKMTLGRFARLAAPAVNGYLVHQYWAQVNENLLRLSESLGEDSYLVRYEDIVGSPVDVTQRLFAFLGSVQRTGVETYQPPKAHQWRWGRDDASDRIKTLRVQPLRQQDYSDQGLLRAVKRSQRAMGVRRQLGYPPLPGP